MLFGDIKGFSKLTDEQVLRFSRSVMGSLAGVLQRHGASIGHRDTWGDAIFVVLTDAVDAAACALEFQGAVAALDLESEGLPTHLALRLGGHVGPVFMTRDPVVGSVGFIGSHVSRTATHRARHPARRGIRDGAVRRRADPFARTRIHLRLRGPHACREGLRAPTHVPTTRGGCGLRSGRVQAVE